MPIRNLPFYPLKYAAKGVEEYIRKRSLEFWKWRRKRYVQYSGVDVLEAHLVRVTMSFENTS